MKRGWEEIDKSSNKKARQSLLGRFWSFLQWLPGVAELTAPVSDFILPPTQAWTRTCPDASLRCPGCGHYLEAPVKQCVNGHTVCLKCRRRLSRCPTCRDHFIRTPQPVLDRLLSTTRLPCLYASFGCPVLEVISLGGISVAPRRDSMNSASRRRDSHSRICSFRPTVCPLCPWESPPRFQDRHCGGRQTAEYLLAHHMTVAHKHHALELDKEHVLFAWLELEKLQTPAFLSCAITVDNQAFVFVMNYDLKHCKFLVVLKHVGSLSENKCRKKSVPLEKRTETSATQKSCDIESAGDTDNSDEFRSPKCDGITGTRDSFERTVHRRIFREQQECQYSYVVELSDDKRIQSVRLAQTAMSKEDALDLAVKTGRCLNVDVGLIDRLLEPGSGRFTVKLTISHTNGGDAVPAMSRKSKPEATVLEESAVT